MKFIKIVLVVIICCSFSPPIDKDAKLEYKFAVGDQYAWIQNTKQLIKQDFMGMEQIVENAIGGTLMLKVISLTPTGANIEAQYIALTMVMKLPAGMPTITMDAEGDQEKTENKVMKAMMNKPFNIVLTRQGFIEKIENEENLWSGFGDLNLDSQQLQAMKRQFEENFGKDAIKSSIEMAMINYPENKVKTGDTWTNKTGIGLNFPLEAANTWSLTTIEKENVNLAADGIITTTDKERITSLPNGLQSKFDLSGTQKITSIINLKTGWPTSVKINSIIKGNMTLLAGGMIPADMEIPMDITTESSFTFVKK